MDILGFLADRFVYPGADRTCLTTTYDVGGIQCYVRHGAGSSRVIVYAHGNETTLEDLRQSGIIDVLAMECNASVVALEYPGYGDMADFERGYGHDADDKMGSSITSVVEALVDSGCKHITLVGRSVGCAIVLRSITRSVCVDENVNNVVLISPFSSLREVFPPLARCVAQNRLDNASAIQKLTCPVLILHGLDDTLIPFEQSEQLKSCCPNAQLKSINGMQHVISSRLISRLCEHIRPFIHHGYGTSSESPLVSFDVFQSQQPGTTRGRY